MEKNSHLKDLQALGSLEIIRAELDVEGSFDDAVSGCDYAFLVAAPMNFASPDPEVHADLHQLLCFQLPDLIRWRCGGWDTVFTLSRSRSSSPHYCNPSYISDHNFLMRSDASVVKLVIDGRGT